MRIHIDIPPALLSPLAADPAVPRAPILAKLGGQTVLLELQGVLESEGDVAGKLIGRLGMEGPLPTLTIAHHLLHGKFVALPKPFAVLRKAPQEETEAEELEAERGLEPGQEGSRSVEGKGKGPARDEPPASSPMPVAPGKARDYSSDMDPASSPYRPTPSSPAFPSSHGPSVSAADLLKRKRQQAMTPDVAAAKRARSSTVTAANGEKRATRYDCVGIVRTKVVFGKRPQPVVNLEEEQP